MTRLLLASDGSPGAETAVRAAANLFPGARVAVATVPPDPAVRVGTAVAMLGSISSTAIEQAFAGLDAEARREAEETAQGAVDRARTYGLDAEIVSVSPSGGPAWAALLDAAHRTDAEVLVCGTRGRGAFARSLLGSTSWSLLHNTDVPLLVVPEEDVALDGPAVIAFDGSPGAAHAIDVAGRVLRGRGAVVVHAWEPTFHRDLVAGALAVGAVDDVHGTVAQLHDALADAAAAKVADGVAAARSAGLDATGEPVEADDGAWRAVAAAAREHGASAIVIGTRGLGAARSVLLGSVSTGLVQNAERPVLVVPDHLE